MSVVGHGIDIVAVSEMQRWIEHPRDPLIPRCFVQAELDEIGDGGDRIERLAGRLAAKEAVLKAIGTGFGAGIAFTDVMIHRVPGAAPEVRLSGGAAKAAMASGAIPWRLSITHAGGIAMASVLALGVEAQAGGSRSADGPRKLMRRASRSTAIRPPRAASTARHTSNPCRMACSQSPVVHCRTSKRDVRSLIVLSS